MRKLIVIVAFALVPFAASAGDVMESSYVLPDGQRVLRHEVLVAAPPEVVWKAVYPPDGKHEILSFLPNEMLSMRSGEKRVFTVIELVRIKDPSTTRVRVSTLPFGNGPEWDAVYKLFRTSNAEMLRKLEEKYRISGARAIPPAWDLGESSQRRAE